MSSRIGLGKRERLTALAFVLAALVTAFCLFGCSGSSGGSDNTSSTSGSAGEPIEASQDNINDENVSVEAVGKFSEGLAWVKYSLEGEAGQNTWIGYMDKDGVIQFCFPSEYKKDDAGTTLDFEDGIVFLPYAASDNKSSVSEETTDYCYAIDTAGNIKNTFTDVASFYDATASCTEYACGGGYVVTSTFNEGFDSASYTYRILGVDGAEEYAFSIDGTADYKVKYCGGGVFAFCTGNVGNLITEKLYFCQTHKSLDLEEHGVPEFVDGGNYALMNNGYTSLTVMSLDGNLNKIEISGLQGDIENAKLSGTTCTLRTTENKMIVSNDVKHWYSYDVVTGVLNELDSIYKEKLKASSSYFPCFYGDRCVLGMNGSDGNSYIGIFDSSWNAIVEPFRFDGQATAYCEGRAFLSYDDGQTEVIDANGDKVYAIEERASKGALCYSDGLVIYIAPDYDVRCLDLEGNVVFDHLSGLDAPSIDISTAEG